MASGELLKISEIFPEFFLKNPSAQLQVTVLYFSIIIIRNRMVGHYQKITNPNLPDLESLLTSAIQRELVYLEY